MANTPGKEWNLTFCIHIAYFLRLKLITLFRSKQSATQMSLFLMWHLKWNCHYEFWLIHYSYSKLNTYFSMISAMVQANINKPSGNCRATVKRIPYFKSMNCMTVAVALLLISVETGVKKQLDSNFLKTSAYVTNSLNICVVHFLVTSKHVTDKVLHVKNRRNLEFIHMVCIFKLFEGRGKDIHKNISFHHTSQIVQLSQELRFSLLTNHNA